MYPSITKSVKLYLLRDFRKEHAIRKRFYRRFKVSSTGMSSFIIALSANNSIDLLPPKTVMDHRLSTKRCIFHKTSLEIDSKSENTLYSAATKSLFTQWDVVNYVFLSKILPLCIDARVAQQATFLYMAEPHI